MIHPAPLRGPGPDTGGQPQLIPELHLPLEGQGRRAEDQEGPLPHQDSERPGGRHREGLSDPHLVGEEEPGRPVFLIMLDEDLHESLLPRGKSLSAAHERALDGDGFR